MLTEIIDHKTACAALTTIAARLDIEIPEEEKMVRFFTVRLENTIMAHKKHAAAYGVLVKALDSAVHGR